MSFDKEEFRESIRAVLKELDSIIPYSENAVELLMMTAAQESHLGQYLRETNPALGLWQIEPRTHNDIWDHDLENSNDNFLSRKKDLEFLVNKFYNHDISVERNLKSNVQYQIVMARLIYYRANSSIPRAKNIKGLAEHYKRHYNTHLGKATVEETIANYKRYCV